MHAPQVAGCLDNPISASEALTAAREAIALEGDEVGQEEQQVCEPGHHSIK